MNVRPEDIENLLNLQECDLQALKLKKRFDELPQRQKIVEVREKKQQLASKVEAVEALLAKADKDITTIVEKDQCLEKRQSEIQKDIDNAGGDFRNLEARTRELAAQGEQREKLLVDLEAAEAEKEKVLAVKQQLLDADKKLCALENAAIESFKAEGEQLQRAMAAQQAKRKALAEGISDDLIKTYVKISQSCGGVAIGVLSGNRCGSCRAPIDDARLLEVKKNAPLATCPHCKRLLVVSS